MRIQQTPLWVASPAGSGEIVKDFLIADTFTDTSLAGGQLSIFPDGRGVSDELMLKTAREMNAPETAFPVRSPRG
ncbi:MAG TPA: PhzF family phenazine biosynthesis protein [Trebonia sp.]|nr:PhzF family phenazine biosynthesis protein [Trebonia sp.]